jgi:CBS domain-containing protein
MGEQAVESRHEPEELGAFVEALLEDIRALEAMHDTDLFEQDVRRVGAEQELFLVDEDARPALVGVEVLETLNHPQFTPELARFNIEANLLPREFGGDVLSSMHAELTELVAAARQAAHAHNADVLLAGILPTIGRSHLGLDAMTPQPRYRALNDALVRLRGGRFQAHIKGVDELSILHDNVMLEACNTSFQIHFQVSPQHFARFYNVAQAVTGPVLAAAVNSPVLLHRRLWQETRVALFQQSVDARPEAHQQRGVRTRVSFGTGWVRESVIEIFREDIARFRALLATPPDESPLDCIARGEPPALSALRLHNGTVYRWNRPCYGIVDGKAHLRIENRALPSGPTIVDEMANAAFYFGLMAAVLEEYGAIEDSLDFDDVKANFVASARRGLAANLHWVGGATLPAQELLLQRLIPLSRAGLQDVGVDADDIEHYLGVLEARVRGGQTGSQWALRSLGEMDREFTPDERYRAVTAAMLRRQQTDQPVHTWPLAKVNEGGDKRASYLLVEHFMDSDPFTVRPEDIVDLAATLMEWEYVRYVPVEDDEGRLAGLISHRDLLRFVGRRFRRDNEQEPVRVEKLMKRDPVTVGLDCGTREAARLMRKHRVGALPVVDDDGQLLGLVTERQFLDVAERLFARDDEQGEPQR